MIRRIRSWGNMATQRKHIVPAYLFLTAGFVVGVWQVDNLSQQRLDTSRELVARLCGEVAHERVSVRLLVLDLVGDASPETRQSVTSILDTRLPAPLDCNP